MHRIDPVRSLTVLAALAASTAAWAAPADFVVDTGLDAVDAMPGDGVCADDDGHCTLRAAIQEANALGGSWSIDLSGVSAVLSLAGAGEDAAATGDLDVTATIDLRATSASLATVSASDLDRAFDVQPGGSLTLHNLMVSDGMVTDDSGGAVRNAGTLRTRNVSFAGNVATGAGASGGAVFNSGGYAELFQSGFSGNMASRAGGAIEASGGTTIVVSAGFEENTAGAAPGNGGAIHLTGTGSVQIRNSRFLDNVASSEGGGVWNSSTGTMTVEDCTFMANEALGMASDNGGGALFNDGGTLTVLRTHVAGNLATMGSGSGGGLFNNGGTVYVYRSLFEDNAAARAGGAIEANAGTTHVLGAWLRGNDAGPAPGNGGALHLTGMGEVTVVRTNVVGNTASSEGGGLWNASTGMMRVADSLIAGNTASGAAADNGGGGLFNDGGVLDVSGSTILRNTADGASGSGGGILNNLGTLTVTDTRIGYNASMRAGGGIEANVGTTMLDGVALVANTTGASPGNGGGFHTTGAGMVWVDACTVTGNSASNEGGGLWNSSTGTMTVTSSTVVSNTAPTGPDLFTQPGGTLTVDGVPVP